MKRLVAVLLVLLMLVNPALACAEEPVTVVIAEPAVEEVIPETQEEAAEEPVSKEMEEAVDEIVEDSVVEEPVEEPVSEETEEVADETVEDVITEEVAEESVADAEEETVHEPEMELVPTTVEDLAAAFGCESIEELAEYLEMTVDALNALTEDEIIELYQWPDLRSSEPAQNPLAKAAAGEFTVEDGVLTAWNGTDSNLVIPADLGITEIGSSVFLNSTDLISVVIPEGVTMIETYAFYGCTNLQSVKLPSSLRAINNYAFYNCSALSSIPFPKNLQGIGVAAFYGTSSLESVDLSNVTIMLDSAFAYSGLSSVTIPAAIEEIPYKAFNNCDWLTSVTIESGIAFIRQSAFYDCDALRTVTIPDTVTKIEGDAFAYCEKLTGVELPSKLEYIGSRAFCYCDGLTSIEFPDSLTKLSSWAFYACNNLQSVNFNKLESIGEYAFDFCDLRTLTIPGKWSTIPKRAFSHNSYLTSLTIEPGVEVIEESAFDCCSSLTEVVLPSTVKQIGSYAFGFEYSQYRPEKLILTIPKSVTRIHIDAFTGRGASSLLVRAFEGSYALDYCMNNSIAYEALPFPTVHSATAEQSVTSTGAVQATFTVKTSTAATSVKLCAESKAAVATFTESNASYTDEDGVRTWTIKYTFANDGARTLYFVGCSSEASSDPLQLDITLKGAQVKTAAFSPANTAAGNPSPIKVTTSSGAAYLHMYAEGGNWIKTWSASGNSTATNSTRTWNVSYVFSNPGNRTMTFKASVDNKHPGNGKTATVAVAACAVNSVAASQSDATIGKNLTFTVKTPSTAKYVKMYSEGGGLVKTWAADGNSTVSGTERIWKLTYAFANPGTRTLTFKASVNGTTMSAGKSVTIKVAALPSMISAAASSGETTVSCNMTFTVKTGSGAQYLTMYAEAGQAVKTWAADGNSTVSGSTRTWKVTYAFGGMGNRTVTFKASVDKVNYSDGKSVSVKVLALPTVSSVSAPAEATVKESITFTVKTATNAQYLTMYAEGGYLVKTWAASGNSTVSGSVRTWKVTYAIGGTGNRTLTFKASADKVKYGAGKNVKVSVVGLPYANSYSIDSEMVVNEENTFTIWSSTNAKYMSLFSEGGHLVKTWEAAGNSEVTNDSRCWEIRYAFGGAGNRKISFRPSADKVNFGDGFEKEIKVLSCPIVSYVYADEEAVVKADTSFSVHTSSSAKYLSMYNEGGGLVKTWEAEENSHLSEYGNNRYWNIEYAFMGAGNRTVTFKASANKVNYGSGEKVSIKVVPSYADLKAEIQSWGSYGETVAKKDIYCDVYTTLSAKTLKVYVNDNLIHSLTPAKDSVAYDEYRRWSFTIRYEETGTYKRKYVITDSSGNIADTVTDTVVVEK